MVRRVVGAAVLTIALAIAAGVAVWFARVHAVAGAVTQQARLARVLVDARANLDERLARTLVLPGLRIVLVDPERDRVIDAVGGSVTVRALPPGPPETADPSGPAGPAGPPGMLQPPGGPPNLAATIAAIHPIPVDADEAMITIAPDVDSLTRWLVGDISAVVAACVTIAGAATLRGAQRSRSERRALELESERRREAAERYQHFLAETAHELRTPLTVVSGYVDILRAGGVHALDPRILEGLQAETARMRLLVAKILTLARLDSPAGVPRLLDVPETTRAAVDTIRRRYPDRDVTFEAASAGGARIVIDADDFTDALGNLIENALKYAPDSGITVAAVTRDGHAAVSVTDGGPGIAPKDGAKIFERFYRGERARAEGLGLGLAIVKGVAERWNGTVDFESMPGRTEFTLRFPVADEERDAVAR